MDEEFRKLVADFTTRRYSKHSARVLFCGNSAAGRFGQNCTACRTAPSLLDRSLWHHGQPCGDLLEAGQASSHLAVAAIKKKKFFSCFFSSFFCLTGENERC